MASMPTLLTVATRNAPAAPPTPLNPAESLPLPPPARQFLGELLRYELVNREALDRFVAQVGTRAGQLTSRDRAADAAVGLKLISRYAATRVLGGQGAGLAFGNWRVADRIGSGSVGVVFRARHATTGRDAAVKVLPVSPDTSPTLVQRFTREVRVLSGLGHPHIVMILDAGRAGVGSDAESLYLALELLPGGDVEEAVYAAGPRPPEVACAWARDAALGLAACHAAGVTHRDVKPSNLMLSSDGAVKIGDFGLAREFDSTHTEPTTLLGSLEFMAPEQLADSPTAGEASDVYGLGGTLFWVLTGQPPYPTVRSIKEAIAAIHAGPARRLSELLPNAPAPLDALLAKMLAPAPGARPSAAQAAAELAKFVPHTVTLKSAESPAQLELARAAVWAALAATVSARPWADPDRDARVAGLTRLLAGALAAKPGWATFADAKALADIERAALIRDLGILTAQSDSVSPSERHDFDRHPVRGDEIIARLAKSHAASLPALRLIRGVIRSHHERWDGSGTPDKLAGALIPPAARLVALAEGYDVARDTHSHAEALDVVRARSGTLFDPEAVAALATVDAAWETFSAEARGEFAMLEVVT